MWKPSEETWLQWIVSLLLILLLMGGCSESEESTRTPTTPNPSTATATASPAPTATATATLRATSTPRPTASPTPTRAATNPTPSLEELAAQYPEIAAILNNPEVNILYKSLLVAYQQGGEGAALGYARQQGLISANGEVLAKLVLDTEDTASTVAQLQGMGITVLGTSGNQVNIAIPPALILASTGQPGAMMNQLAGLEHVIGVLPP